MINKIAKLVFVFISIYLLINYDLTNHNLSGIVVDFKTYLLVLILSISYFLANYHIVKQICIYQDGKFYGCCCILPNLIPYSINKDIHLIFSYLAFSGLMIIFYNCVDNYILKYRRLYLKIFLFNMFIVLLIVVKDLYIKTYSEYLFLYSNLVLLMFIEKKERLNV